MKILVCNIGSTSFKFRLFRIADGQHRELARGGADRIGQTGGQLTWRITPMNETALAADFADHGQAIRHVLVQLAAGGALARTDELSAVAFKAVMAGDAEPVCLVDDDLLSRMEYFAPVAPAHNPPYVAAMRLFRTVLGDTPLVACFEPGFHATNPPRRRFYAVPREWADRYGVKRYGFHGASHRYIAQRIAELSPQASRVISCHLGGSSSLCAIRGGRSVATSMGLSPQSGLPQSNRAGEFDLFALELLKRQANMNADAVLAAMAACGGLAALSGGSGDMRDIRERAAAGDAQAKLAIEVFTTAVRDYLGAYLVELGGADAIVFTGGIGQNDPQLRSDVCANLGFAGIALDEQKNASADGEVRIESANSRSAIWVMPTNEELVVAWQTADFLAARDRMK